MDPILLRPVDKNVRQNFDPPTRSALPMSCFNNISTLLLATVCTLCSSNYILVDNTYKALYGDPAHKKL